MKKKRRKALEPIHVVQKNETLKSISQLHGIRLSSLCKKNNLSIEDTWLLNNHFRSQKPTIIKNRKFRIKKKNLKDLSYWWNKNNETTQKRKDFIAMLIDKTKPIKLLEYDNLVSIKIK